MKPTSARTVPDASVGRDIVVRYGKGSGERRDPKLLAVNASKRDSVGGTPGTKRRFHFPSEVLVE